MSSLPHPEPVPARLRSLEPSPAARRPRAALDPDYDYPTCRELAANLSDATIGRVADLFALLTDMGTADADAVSGATGLPARDLAGQLTAPLRRHADALGLPLPFILDSGADPATRRWHDRAGIAARMVAALRDERASRPAFATTGVAGAYRHEAATRAAPIQMAAARVPAADPYSDPAVAFAPLVALLTARPGDREITLTFGQIEAITGAELPPVARRAEGWWTDASGPGTGRLWHALGRRAITNIETRSVTFARTEEPVHQLVPAETPLAPGPSPVLRARPARRARGVQTGRALGRLMHGLVHPPPAAHAGDS